MFYINLETNVVSVGKKPEFGNWILVNNPAYKHFKLKKNWKECIPEVWEFNPFKVSLELNILLREMIDDKLNKTYSTYVNEIINFKIEIQKEIENIKSQEDVDKVLGKISKISENNSTWSLNSNIYN